MESATHQSIIQLCKNYKKTIPGLVEKLQLFRIGKKLEEALKSFS
jgi:hypothetical protein